jgi:hypothetical protein
MPSHPLTHHEILGLVAPFTRRGRHVDLGASNRLERQLLFRPAQCRLDLLPGVVVHETLMLTDLGESRYRLTRILAPEGGPEARLRAEGDDPGVLLGQVEAVPPARHFEVGPGYLIAYGYELNHTALAASDDPSALHLVVEAAQIRCDGLVLTLDPTSVSGTLADVELLPGPGGAHALPQDLLAVLGWQWTRLTERDRGWTCRLRIRGREPARSVRIRRHIEEAARHLARTLAEPPARFHERLRLPRWGVFLRRAVPLLTCIALVAAAACVPKLHLAEGSGLRAVIFNAPPILMMLFFCLHEVPTIEIPPVPRRSRTPSWRKADA